MCVAMYVIAFNVLLAYIDHLTDWFGKQSFRVIAILMYGEKGMPQCG